MPALAYFLTWTTYATWLPGDPRGWVDDNHSRRGEPYLYGSNGPSTLGKTKLRETPFIMNDEDRRLVQAAIEDHCAIREWIVHALNVRTNHVHLVVTAAGREPEEVMGQLKAWSTRSLKAEDRHVERAKFWTNQGSTRYMFTTQATAAAIRYTNDQ